MTALPAQSESDINSTPLRAAWQSDHLGERSRALLARDNRAFLQPVGVHAVPRAGRQGRGAVTSRTWTAGGTWTSTATTSTTSATRTRASSPPSRRNWTTSASRHAASRASARSSSPKRSAIVSGRSRAIAGRVLFTTGGSDAVEVAIRLARIATGRFKTLSFWDAFHGAGFGASSVGGESLFRGGGHGPLLPGSEHVAPFGCYRCAYGHKVDADGRPNLTSCALACAQMVRYVLEREGDVAAVIAEPARAVPYMPPPGTGRRCARPATRTARC